MDLITSAKRFLFVYDFLTGLIEYNSQQINRLNYLTRSGQEIKFIAEPGHLEWGTSEFLLDNIFYLKRNNKIYFSDDINSFKGLSSFNKLANQLINVHGYLPHSLTQLTDVRVICSFLKYSITLNEDQVEPCFVNTISQYHLYTVDDLYFALRLALKRQIEKNNSSQYILPLSGGMDSRLLLNLLLDEGVDVQFFTVGTPLSGDVRVACEVIRRLGLKNKHVIFDLESLTRNDLLDNYSAVNYLLPLDRILTVPLNRFFESSTVLSGLYGDVIFSDNLHNSISYSDYIALEKVGAIDDFDAKIISAYNRLPSFRKLQRTLLRCQKLTRQSFPINSGFNYIAPFVDPEIICIASAIRSRNIYADLVRRFMKKELQKIIHQSTLSYFTHPPLLRKFERKLFKLMRHPDRHPYYDEMYLRRIGVAVNEAPFLNL
jgi:hypothetical protein